MRLFVIMGVAGCGKSTIGAAVAAAQGGVYLDGDAFHPQANIDKMSSGAPLTDDDRWPWLDIFAREISSREGLVFGGCSALKRSYRDRITSSAGEPVCFVHLAGDRELIEKRMAAREGHFMPTSLLDSQFQTLEVPGEGETAVSVDIDAPIDVIVARIQAAIADCP